MRSRGRASRGGGGGGGGGPVVEPLSEGFSAARRGTIKCNFTAAPRAGKERFLCLFQINIFMQPGGDPEQRLCNLAALRYATIRYAILR